MNTIQKFFGHLSTVTRHRHLVIAHCARAGILWQGLRHDLSKYGKTEFWQGVRFFDGTHSPTEDERRTGARPTRTCCATGRSSSRRFSITP